MSDFPMRSLTPLVRAAMLKVSSQTPLGRILEGLGQARTGCAVVIEQGCLVGCVSTQDVVQAMATQPATTEVRAAIALTATPSVVYVPDLRIIAQVLPLFQQGQQPYLLVCNSVQAGVVEDNLVGILAYTDVLALFDPVAMPDRLLALQQQLDQVTQTLEQEVAQRQYLEQRVNPNTGSSQFSPWPIDEILSGVVASITRFRHYEDHTWVYDYRSPGCEAIFGYTVDELMTDPNLWLSRVFPDDRETVIRPSWEALLQGQPSRREYRFRHQDGTLRWISSVMVPQWDATERCWIVTATAMDITDRKEREEALRNSEELFRAVFEQAGLGIAIARPPDCKLANANPALQRMLGYTAAELAQLDYQAITEPEDLRLERPLVEAMRQGLRDHYTLEKRYVRKDGQRLWVRLTATAIRYGSGQTRVAIALVEDIHDRKHAEQEIQFQANLLNQVSNAVICVDLEGQITYWNHYAETLYQWTAEEVLGRRMFEIYIPLEGRALAEASFRTLKADYYWEGEIWVQRKDRSQFPAHVVKSAIRDDQGAVVGFVGVSTDISDRKQAEILLQGSLREKDSLLSEIHHRVKNNLQIVSSLLSLQALRMKDRAVQRVLEDSWTRVDSMALVHESLYRTRNFAAVALEEYLQQLLCNLFQIYSSPHSQIGLTVNVPEQMALSLEQSVPCGLIVNELVTNALKHGVSEETSGHIGVSLAVDQQQQVTLIVSNTGDRLPPDFDLATLPSMGLQLVQNLVEQLDGQLEVERGDPTRFIVRFQWQDPVNAMDA